MSSLAYRRDIDGLRAIAVLPVLFFHAGFSGFSGGFVGVDIFFVISGFLITSIIARELNQESFAFVNFWARRARRILPAAVVVIIVTLILGWFLLAPEDYIELARSARSQAFFAANFFFWEETGYFDGPSELKPLLHTWSLAVEEQFYMLFPLLMVFLHKFFLTKKHLVLVVLFVASLAASIIFVKSYPATTFYLLPTRAWELLLGSMLALMPFYKIRYRGLAEITSLAGLGAIGYCVAVYNSATVFPGLNAVLPTLGTALIIWGNSHHHTFINRLLSLQVFVWIGLISYSLYLWHWPVMAFTRYLALGELTLIDKSLLVIISIILAYFSWKFIETPFRKKKFLQTNKKILYGAFASILAVALAGQQIRMANGVPSRLPEYAQNYAAGAIWSKVQRECYKLNQAGELCRFSDGSAEQAELFFWGDSHAAALLPAVIEATNKSGVLTLHASKSSCPPLKGEGLGGKLRKGDPKCTAFNELMVSQLESLGIKHVLLAGAWSTYIHTEVTASTPLLLSEDSVISNESKNAQDTFRHHLTALLKDLQEKNIHVWIVRQIPRQNESMAHFLTKLAMKKLDTSNVGLPLVEHQKYQALANTVLDDLAGQNVTILDPTPLMCVDGFCSAQKNGYSLYKDSNHLSVQGAMLLEGLFRPVFKAIKS
ncbi:O-antigen acetylase [gamma proteobacterium IMCC2047]|nr:O-antigen acetylase [gamma proteobacterium IMCC2047]